MRLESRGQESAEEELAGRDGKGKEACSEERKGKKEANKGGRKKEGKQERIVKEGRKLGGTIGRDRDDRKEYKD